MWGNKRIILIVIIGLLGSIFSSKAQEKTKLFPRKTGDPIALSVVKTGPYFGVQRGKYTAIEIGMQRQWKNVKLRNAETQALHTGFNYALSNHVLGYEIGYWTKQSRLALTYGLHFDFRTNFDQSRVGFSPVIGYKISLLHLQTGYTFLTPSALFTETNRFFIRLRLTLINDRSIEFNKRKKR
jgi:hypothetical protein